MTTTLGNCVCVCDVCVMCHVSGTFQKEGKDFPGTGNLAQDNDAAGVNSLCSSSKICLFQRTAIWSQLGGIFYSRPKNLGHTVSDLNCDGKTAVSHLLCTPQISATFPLRPCLPELPHTPLIAGWFTAHRTSPLICPLVKPPTHAAHQYFAAWKFVTMQKHLHQFISSWTQAKSVPGRGICCITWISVHVFFFF